MPKLFENAVHEMEGIRNLTLGCRGQAKRLSGSD